MPNSISIRVATSNDVDTIFNLVMDLAKNLDHVHDVQSTVEDLREYGFGDHAFYKALIAEQGGKPVGLCIYYMTFSSWRGKPGGCILDLYVDESVRGTGLGRRLMAEVAYAGSVVGSKFLHLAVHHSNESGQTFYQRMGMTSADTEQVYQIEGENLVALIGEVEEK